MGLGRIGPGKRRAMPAAIAGVTLAGLVWTGAARATPDATITADPFTDSCRYVTLHSSKDISHVEIHYADDGRVVKNEAITGPHHAIDGSSGEEIAFVVVKSARTTETFACTGQNEPPTAILELEAPSCVLVATDAYHCGEMSAPRTTWLNAAAAGFGCSGDTTLCDTTFRFRGIGSTDQDEDISTWSIDFGNGTVASGDWTTQAPTSVPLTITLGHGAVVTLTVTDSAGQTGSDTMHVTQTLED